MLGIRNKTSRVMYTLLYADPSDSCSEFVNCCNMDVVKRCLSCITACFRASMDIRAQACGTTKGLTDKTTQAIQQHTMTLPSIFYISLPANFFVKEDCLRLMHECFHQYFFICPYAMVYTYSTPILVGFDGTMVLWAQSTTPFVECVDMTHPRIHLELMELAESGARWVDYQSIRYGFSKLAEMSIYPDSGSDGVTTMSCNQAN